MKFTLYRKHLIITIAVTLASVALASIATFLMHQFDREQFENMPLKSNARLLDKLVTHGHSIDEALTIINSTWGERSPFVFSLMDRNEFARQQNAEANPLPHQPYETKSYRSNMMGPPSISAAAIESEPQKLLIMQMAGPGRPGGPPPRPPRMFLFSLIAQILSVIIASTVSLFILFYSMRERAHLANRVFKEMKSGNLKARFPIRKLDEVGQLMLEFNKMADEIERLVARLKTTEQARMALLQELAHDLRTPIASLKNLLETLHLKKLALNENLRDELTALSLREIEYFERLIEDLLFLAQVNEPQYHPEKSKINIGQLLDDELNGVSIRHQSAGKPIAVHVNYAQAEIELRGDSHLLRRLFRNALENAFSFARSSVELHLEENNNQLIVRIHDDGPGFSLEALKGFGDKRVTRHLDRQQGQRLSVGLGSVIMKAVTDLHGGEVSAQNILKPDGSIGGALVTITLERSA